MVDPTVEPDSSTGEPAVCEESTELAWVPDALVTPGHPCRAWLDVTHGRVGQVGTASASVWTRRTFFGTGILLSAAHLLGEGAFGDAGTDIPARLEDPTLAMGELGAVFPEFDGSALMRDTYSPTFTLYNPAIPAAESGNGLADILPRNDFYMKVIDGQSLPIDMRPPPMAEPLAEAPMFLYDPDDHTVEPPTVGIVGAGALVVLHGIPSQGEFAGMVVYSVGHVLDSAEAEAAIGELAGAGDPAGTAPYDAEAEFVVAAVTEEGMSGGAVFDEGGIHVGMLGRRSTTPDANYIRATRSTFIVEQLQATFDTLEPEVQEAVALYLEAE
jgi:hypothetical protein